VLPMNSKIEQQGGVLKVGVLGCGNIARYHLRFISESPYAELSAIADLNLGAARKLAEHYPVGKVCGSLEEMLDTCALDLVHVLTPPFLHKANAIAAIERGVHIFVEKPIALSKADVEDLYEKARCHGVKLCPDFCQLFQPNMREALARIRSGEWGRPVHVEFNWGLDINEPHVRECIGTHWSFNLPGGFLHNYISHPLYLVLSVAGKPRRINVIPKHFGMLPQGLTDHLTIQCEGECCTASVVLSLVNKPNPYYCQVFCERGSIFINFETQTTLVRALGSMPRAIQRATANFVEGDQLARNGVRNIVNFARKRLVPYQGLKNLLDAYHNSLLDGFEPPVSCDLSMAVAMAEDAVIAQSGKVHLDLSDRVSQQINLTQPLRVLVTGATGHVGPPVVRQLVENGYCVRALVRGLSRTTMLERLGVELMYGDIRDLESLTRAAQDMDVIVHMAAGVRGSTDFVLDCCIRGTQNVAEAARLTGVQRVIYLSSMAIYDFSKLRNGDEISENSPLDLQAEARSAYALGKRRAEDLALAELRLVAPAWTILRPSYIAKEGVDASSAVGCKFGNLLICFGMPRRAIRVIHAEEVATVVIGVLQNESTRGKVFTISEKPIALREFIRRCVRANGSEHIKVLYLPYRLAWMMVQALQLLRTTTSKGPSMNIRRLHYLYRDLKVSTRAIQEAIGWETGDDLLDRLNNGYSPAKLPVTLPQDGVAGVDSRSDQEVSVSL
jgi:2-alkyl-3-oxoalkanoate reductase